MQTDLYPVLFQWEKQMHRVPQMNVIQIYMCCDVMDKY